MDFCVVAGGMTSLRSSSKARFELLVEEAAGMRRILEVLQGQG